MKKQLKVPHFKNEDEEFAFWSSIDLADYFEPSDFKPFNFKQFTEDHQAPKSKKITIRIPTDWLVRAKDKAARQSIPYQRLLKEAIYKDLFA